MKVKDTYKILVRRKNTVIMRQCSSSIKLVSSGIKARYPDATVEQVGRKTTREAALAWVKEHYD